MVKRFSHFVEFLLVGFFYVVCRILPRKWASNLCGGITGFLGPRLKGVNKRMVLNLNRVYPDMPLTEKKTIETSVWENMGRIFGELPHLYKQNINDKSFLKIEGEEFINNDKQKILVSAHYGNWEVLAHALTDFIPGVISIYRTSNNPFVDRLICFARRKLDMAAKGRTGTRKMVKGLKDGRSVAILIDQRMNDGIDIPFLGHDAKTSPVVVELAYKYNAQIVPCFCRRDANDPHQFTLVFKKPIPLEKKQNTEKTLTKVNDVLSKEINTCPGQWFWLHRRWGK